MKIEKAIYTKKNELMTVEQVAQHEDHLEVIQSLQCVTTGCSAKISYVPGNGNKSDFFRAVKTKNHSPECRKEQEEEELKEKIEYRNTVEGTLDAKGIKQRVTYFFNKLNKSAKETGSNKGKSKKSKVTTDTTKKKIGITVVLGNSKAPSVKEIKEYNENTSVRVTTKQLNQLSHSDVGKFLQLNAPIKKVTKTKNGFEILICQGKKEAKLIINEAFIKGTRDVQVKDYLRSLAQFIDARKNDYEVSIYSFCVVEVCEENEIILSVSSFEEFFLSVSGKYNQPIKLDSYQALLVSGVWN